MLNEISFLIYVYKRRKKKERKDFTQTDNKDSSRFRKSFKGHKSTASLHIFNNTRNTTIII